MEDHAKLIARKYPTLAEYNVWGWVDGVKFKVKVPKDSRQNAYYTAFKKMHVVNNVVAFDATGR